MSRQRHVIKKQLIEIELPAALDARAVQTELSRTYRQRMIPLIEETCSALVGPNEIVSIDRLEIDLGDLELAQLEQELVSRIRQALPEALAQQLSVQRAHARKTGMDAPAASQLELLALFLRTGAVPWWADSAQLDLVPAAVDWLLQSAPQQLGAMLAELLTALLTLQRLITNLDDARLAGVVVLLLPHATPTTSRWLRELAETVARQRLLGPLPAPVTHRRLWRAIWQAVMSTERGVAIDDAAMLRATVAAMSTVGLTADKLRSVLPAGSALADLIDRKAVDDGTVGAAGRLELERGGAATAADATASDGSPEIDDSGRQASAGTAQRPASERGGATAQQETDPDREPVRLSDEPEEIYVGNAGLVLLWPYLEQFFARLDLVVDRRFRSDAHRNQAVALLQLLATGAPAFVEYQLPLNKVLCGVAPETVVELDEPLPENMIAACDQLLEAVIANAQAFGDISAAGLRWRDGAWLLQVERVTYDLILNRLPWRWDWVKLPWMHVPLRVEW